MLVKLDLKKSWSETVHALLFFKARHYFNQRSQFKTNYYILTVY